MVDEKKANNDATPDSTVAQNSTAEETEKKNPVKLWTSVVITLCLVLFIGHLLADKYTPYTSNARVEAFVVPIVPLVSGPLTRVDVTNNQVVSTGQVLAVIDSANYELAVRSAQADFQMAGQSSQADLSSVSTAQARVAEAEANLRNAEIKGERIIKLSKKGAASKSRADDARASIASNRAKLASARSELEKAESNLGATGQDNAKIQSAMAGLEAAKLDLHRSTIRAPSDGIITNLTVDVGNYAGTGAPIMTFISIKDVWIQAAMRENCLVNIKKNDPVELVLDAAPGRIIQGEVMNIGYGVSDNSGNTTGGLTTVQETHGWLRQAQLMPVLVRLSDIESAKGALRVGGQANLIIYTGNNSILNTVGRLWIRMISLLSHIY